MSLITCGSIHQGHEWLSDDSRGRQEICMCSGALPINYCAQFYRLRCQDIDQVLLDEVIFFTQYVQQQ